MFFHNKRKSILLQLSCAVNISLGHHYDSVIFQFNRNPQMSVLMTALLAASTLHVQFLYTHPHQAFSISKLSARPGLGAHQCFLTAKPEETRQNKSLSI